MRNPNGFGSVSKMSGKRRKSWRTVITTGYDIETGKQKRSTIGYFETKKEAMEALVEYNQNPYDIEISKTTFKEVFEKWSIQHFKNVSIRTKKQYQAMFVHFKCIENKEFSKLKAIHLQELMNNIPISPTSKRLIKSILSQLYKYAMKYEIVDKDYSSLLDMEKKSVTIIRKPYTEDEILKLWKYKELEWVDTVLIMIYSGLRIGELLTIKNQDIDLENRTIKGGIKTDAGKNRIIPINKKILPLIKSRMIPANEFLIVGKRGNKIAYQNYNLFFHALMNQLQMKHTIHDCRHTFATLLSNANANETTIAKIIGHSDYETTKNIYTHKDINELKKAIDLI